MAITQHRIEQLLTAAEQLNQSFVYNSRETLGLVQRARQQIKNADLQTAHSILITLLHDLTQLHMDYQQQIAQPQLVIAVEREHWRLTHRRNEYKRQWLADKRAGIPTRGRAQYIAEYQQDRSEHAAQELLDYYETSEGFEIPGSNDT